MTDQADMEARAQRLRLDRRIHNQRVDLRQNWMITEMRSRSFGAGALKRYRDYCLKQRQEIVQLTAQLAEREAAAYARAAEVARSVKRRVPYDQNKHPCTTTMEQIARAIEALGEAKG